MKVEKQLNLDDRTLLLGVSEFDTIPKVVIIDSKKFRVIGTSFGVKLPKLSLEIEKTSIHLVGETITSF